MFASSKVELNLLITFINVLPNVRAQYILGLIFLLPFIFFHGHLSNYALFKTTLLSQIILGTLRITAVDIKMTGTCSI